MSQASGVIVNGRRVNPYESPTLQVTSFSPSSFWKSNVIQLESISSRQSGNDPSMLQLGAPDTCVWTSEMILRLAQDYNNQDTIATMDRVTVSASHKYTEEDILGIFTHVEEGCDFFSFSNLRDQAIFGTWDTGETHIITIMDRLIRGIRGEDTMPSFRLAKSTLQEALRAIYITNSHVTVPVSPARPLIEAWHQHVREVRHPRFQTAHSLLEQADQHVKQLSRDLVARGVRMTRIRQVKMNTHIGDRKKTIANIIQDLVTVHTRLLQLRLIVQTYLQGAWE